jgi:hypothetical protein
MDQNAQELTAPDQATIDMVVNKLSTNEQEMQRQYDQAMQQGQIDRANLLAHTVAAAAKITQVVKSIPANFESAQKWKLQRRNDAVEAAKKEIEEMSEEQRADTLQRLMVREYVG